MLRDRLLHMLVVGAGYVVVGFVVAVLVYGITGLL